VVPGPDGIHDTSFRAATTNDIVVFNSRHAALCWPTRHNRHNCTQGGQRGCRLRTDGPMNHRNHGCRTRRLPMSEADRRGAPVSAKASLRFRQPSAARDESAGRQRDESSTYAGSNNLRRASSCYADAAEAAAIMSPGRNGSWQRRSACQLSRQDEFGWWDNTGPATPWLTFAGCRRQTATDRAWASQAWGYDSHRR